MLREIQPKASGIEQSAFRRAKLFRDYLGIEVNLVTHIYQNDLFEQRNAYGLDVPVLNPYEYFQEINRETIKPHKISINTAPEGWTIERRENECRVYRENGNLAMFAVFALEDHKLSFIEFFNREQQKTRRDVYDALGFLSCRQNFDPETDSMTEMIFYRPDKTVAIHETIQNDEITLIRLVDRHGMIIAAFNRHEDFQSYWLAHLLSDKTKIFFLIGDRTPDWHKDYIDIKAAGLKNVHVIHQLHNLHVLEPFDPLTSQTKARYQYLYDDRIKSDAIISLTSRQHSDIVRRYHLKNIVTIPHSLANVPKIKNVEVNPFKIVQVGRLVPDKGQFKAIEVMKRVIRAVPQANLHFYGRGFFKEHLQRLIDENNLSEHVKLEGFNENMPKVFASSALSILPSLFEGSPLVVQESLQQNCPVVAFDCNYGPADAIRDGVNGYLVPVDDIDAMASRIIRILAVPKLRDKLSENCARTIEKFSPKIVAGQWEMLFNRLMKGE